MATWGDLTTWGSWSSWPFTVTAGVTWGDWNSWGDLETWFDPSGSAPPPGGAPSMRPLVVDYGGVGVVDLPAPTMRPLPSIKAHIGALSSTGAALGPASVAASGITVATPELAPTSRFMAVTSVDAATVTLFLTPVEEPPTDGIAVIYAATQPTHTTPFLWVTPDGDLYLVED